MMCDFAETYHIYNIKSLSVNQTAIFLYGLRDNSRVKMKLAGRDYDFDRFVLTAIFDKLQWLCWAQSEDGKHNRNRPQLLTEMLTRKESADTVAFESGEEFEERRRELLKGG